MITDFTHVLKDESWEIYKFKYNSGLWEFMKKLSSVKYTDDT